MSETMQEAWNEVEEYLARAKGIAYDTCHKIYILMDDNQMSLMQKYGYDPLISTEGQPVAALLDTVKFWYDSSCGLEFVDAVSTVPAGVDENEGFTTLIPQGFGDYVDCQECGDEIRTVDFDIVDGYTYCLGCQPEVEDDEDE